MPNSLTLVKVVQLFSFTYNYIFSYIRFRNSIGSFLLVFRHRIYHIYKFVTKLQIIKIIQNMRKTTHNLKKQASNYKWWIDLILFDRIGELSSSQRYYICACGFFIYGQAFFFDCKNLYGKNKNLKWFFFFISSGISFPFLVGYFRFLSWGKTRIFMILYNIDSLAATLCCSKLHLPGE